jgi:hypothetical protein
LNSCGQSVDGVLKHQPEAALIGNQQTAQHFGIEVPLTAQQLAGIVPLHPVTLLRWAREGKIPHRRLSARKIVFLPGEIRRWLAGSSGLYSGPVGHAA